MSIDARSAKSMHLRQTPWLGVLPFLLLCLAFEIIPILMLVKHSFADRKGVWTLANYQAMSAPLYARSFWNSIRLSAITAVLGVVLRLLDQHRASCACTTLRQTSKSWEGDGTSGFSS